MITAGKHVSICIWEPDYCFETNVHLSLKMEGHSTNFTHEAQFTEWLYVIFTFNQKSVFILDIKISFDLRHQGHAYLG